MPSSRGVTGSSVAGQLAVRMNWGMGSRHDEKRMEQELEEVAETPPA